MTHALMLQALLSLPLDTLELFHVSIQDKLTLLRSEVDHTEKNKKQAARISGVFAKAGMSLVEKKRGMPLDPNTMAGRVRQGMAMNLGGKELVAFVQEVHPDTNYNSIMSTREKQRKRETTLVTEVSSDEKPSVASLARQGIEKGLRGKELHEFVLQTRPDARYGTVQVAAYEYRKSQGLSRPRKAA